MKFKAPIEVQAGISDGDPTNPLGISGYLLSSDGSNVNWVSPGGLSASTAEAVVQPIKANEALTKGDPLYIVGYQTGQDVNIVAKADSSDVAKMPVVGLADDDYANQAFGTMTAFGSFNGDFDTTGGTESWAVGDIIFVKPGGGLTNIKPGGTDLIQNVAIVSRVNSQTGELEVIALGRTNDVPNLPTGRLFVGTATNTSLASDVIYVDDTNDRVGIRTTGTPSTNLEVSSSSNLNGIDISKTSNPTQSGALFFTTNTLSEGFLFRNSNGTFQINSGGVPNNTSGTNRISIVGSSGNVGIGTTAPGTKLEVNGNTRIVGSLQLYLGSTSNQYLSISNTFGSTFINTGTSGETIFIGAPSTYQSNLQLQGDFIVRGGSSSTSIQTKSSLNVITNKIVDSGISYFNAGNVGIGTTSPSDRLEVAAANSQLRLRDTDDNNFAQFSYSSGKLVVRNNSTTTTVNQFTLDSIGRMGIGTTSPNEKLEVNGSVRVTGAGLDVGYGNNSNNFVQIGNGRTTNGFAFIDLVGDTTYSDYGLRLVRNNGGANTNSEIIHRGTGALNLNVTQAGSITLKTSNVERVRVNSSGNVGIGTTNPRTKLHVLGTTSSMPALGAAPSAAQLGGSTYGTLFSTLTSGRGVIQQGRSDGTAGSYDLLLQPVGGKVAIARTSATYTLDVGGTGRFTDTLYYSSLVQQSQADTKKDIANIDKNKATAIPFKQYKYKTGDTERVRYGVVVEDIEQYYPELVHIGEDGIKGVSYIDLLVKRVAELEKELEDISLTPGPKGDTGATGATGANGADGSNGADGNSHLSNVTSIAFNPKANRLQVNIGGTVYNFAPSK